ncbi:MAG TPA: alpha-E domain-containing protein [Opitutaceae bacterium]|nr:alpha-E domain-containing protein [Opitutaceae bacterium]
MKAATFAAPPRRKLPMLSRVANSLYWLGRYFERAENTARLLDVNLQLLLDSDKLDDAALAEHWQSLLQSTGDAALFAEHNPRIDAANVSEFMTFNTANPNSILSCIFAARENARMIRDRISLEMWETVNDLHLFLKSAEARAVWQGNPAEFFARIKNASHLFQGLTGATFPHDEGYNFIQLGRFIERADKTIRLLDLKYHLLLPDATEVGGAVDTAQWRAVLRCASALEAYRRFYVSEILPWKVAEFLLFSETFPRSVRFCLAQIDFYLRRISGTPVGQHSNEAERLCGRLVSELNYTSIDEVFRKGLHEFLAQILPVLDEVGGIIFATFMTHRPIDELAETRLHQQEEQQQQAVA